MMALRVKQYLAILFVNIFMICKQKMASSALANVYIAEPLVLIYCGY